MMKKRLSILLVLIMVLTMLPGNVVTVSAVAPPVAKIGEQGFGTLQAAVNAVTEGQTIMLNLETTTNVTVDKEFDFFINLNGKTLYGGTDPAILKRGSGTLKITDTVGGVVMSNTSIDSVHSICDGTIKVASGSAIIMGGTVRSTGSGYAIQNFENCSVSVTGGTVENTSSGDAIYNEGSVNVSGGTVSKAGFGGYTIENIDNGSVSVTGGTVVNTGGDTIYNEGSVNVSGSGKVQTRIHVAINNRISGRVNVSGGTVEATEGGYAIDNVGGSVTLTGGMIGNGIHNSDPGTISIPSGTVEISGGDGIYRGAMNAVPNLTVTDVQILSRTGNSESGYTWSSVPTLSSSNINSFIYLKFIYVSTPPTNGGGAPVKKEGKLEKDQKKDGNAPTANLKDSTEELKAKVLSATEQEQVAAGKDAKVILKVQDIGASVSAEDKKLIEETLTAGQQNTANPALLYIDISLYKQIGDGQETKVTETSGKIKISIEVPESMRSTDAGANRTYRVVRIHNGVTELLEGTYDPATHLFTFETDRFSTYALTYQDNNTTTDLNNGGTTDQLTVAKDFSHLRLTAKAYKTSQKLTYAKVAGADGYLIYGAQYGKKLKKLADVEGTTRNYTVKKLKKGTYYTYQVKAYKVVDGKKVTIAESNLIYSVTASKTYGNPTKLIIKKSSLTLIAGKTTKVTYQVVLPENKKMKDFAGMINFETTNPVIATISKSGTITAKAKGTCYVYVYAQNGVYKKIKVTVE